MTDRELLELAAKAVGHESHWNLAQAHQLWKNGGYVCFWNPLTDDGEALRLAVKLNIDIGKAQDDLHNEIGDETYHIDRYAATRRAIVLAAAEIGKAMT